MTNLKYIVCFLVTCLSITLAKGQILTVKENDRGTKRLIELSKKQIIDINSQLEVSISKEKLLAEISSQFPQYGEQIALDKKIIALREVLKSQSEVLNILEKEVATVSDQDTFFKLMDIILVKIIANPYLSSRYEELNDEFGETYGFASDENLEAFVFSNLGKDIEVLKNELKNIETEKYKISLVSFKKDNRGGDRVHVKNFDHYSEREYTTIDRWVTSLSESQKKDLRELSEISKENNDKAISVFEQLKTFANGYFSSLDCIKEIKNDLSSFIQDPKIKVALNTTIKDDASELVTELNHFISFIHSMDTDIKTWDIGTPFLIGDELKKFTKVLKDVELNSNSLFNDLNTIVSIKSESDLLKNDYKKCLEKIKKDFKKVEEAIALMFNNQSNYLANKEIGKEVLAFSIDNLPENGYINLKGTGKRVNGDELLVEVILRIPSKTPGVPDNIITLEERNFVMQLIGVRSEVLVGLIMANPFDEKSLGFTPKREFFFTPSASLLFKIGSKNSYFYNEFIDAGIGVNFSAPDFDTDGAPEFGTGIILTGMKDILSVGINYNVTLNTPYWFFGVNLPFSLQGLPFNSVKK